ncbi:hypothetical protein CEXT_541961 [Caerostris extrusa]|uniref:Uncharacterized protein n=1 Tax=Caerostris extrusa TaxID=172846 RepID=A0AAV4MIZ2_CAEEX|nr:hypothetical protein CEXT_541961 [Caerostris extrusa]
MLSFKKTLPILVWNLNIFRMRSIKPPKEYFLSGLQGQNGRVTLSSFSLRCRFLRDKCVVVSLELKIWSYFINRTFFPLSYCLPFVLWLHQKQILAFSHTTSWNSATIFIAVANSDK